MQLTDLSLYNFVFNLKLIKLKKRNEIKIKIIKLNSKRERGMDKLVQYGGGTWGIVSAFFLL